MNRKCHGGTLRVGSSIFWRCLFDGALVQTKKVPEICPHCNRETVHDKKIHDCPTRTVRQLRLPPPFESWVEMPREEE